MSRLSRLGMTLSRRGRSGAMVALAALCVVSLAVRAAGLGAPCRTPCHSAAAHLLIFDEDYYVNAARVIAGVRPPTGVPYAHAPSGDDPNAEHPQLAKLAVAGLIEVLGDGPLAWRLPSLLLGTLCLAGLYVLVRAAGGGPWPAVGAGALMAADNLLLVHGRIDTLDIFALTGMVWGAAAYLRGRPVLAGVAIGLGACTKLVAPYVLFALALFELLGGLDERRTPPEPVPGAAAGPDRVGPDGAGRRAARLLVCGLSAAVVLVAVLGVLDAIAPPYDDAAGRLVTGGPFGHLAHMFRYAAAQTSPHGPTGIASYPWQWLVDSGAITYLNIDPASPAAGLEHVHPAVHFLGLISPPILLTGLLGLLWAGYRLWRPEPRGRGAGARGVELPGAAPAGAQRLPALAVAWFLGCYLPFVVASLVWQRTSYLYYMVIVTPGLYMGAVALAARLWHRRRLRVLWIGCVVAAAVIAFPLTPLP